MTSKINTIWTELNADLERYVCVRVDHQDHCNDILHDVFLKLVANVEKIETVDNIKAYLTRIASNTIIDHYRTSKSAVDISKIEEHSHSEGPSCTAGISEEFLEQAIQELPGKYRDALIKTDLEGMSQTDYAHSLGISVSGAKSRVQRAREKLKDLILKCCDYQFDKYGNVLKCCGEDVGYSHKN